MKLRTFGGKPTPETGQISEDELRDNLDAFEEYFRGSVKETVDTVNEIDITAKTRRTSLMIQMRTSQAINAMLDHEDPVVAFIEVWGFVVRLHQYLEEGAGRSLFGDNQHMFTEMAAQFEARIEAIGKTFMKDDVFEENRKHVYNFARSNPIKASFSNTIVYSTMVQEEGKPGPFESAMEGVDRTATAVDRFTDKADRFSSIVEQLPESVRWELLSLLYDFEETEMTKSFLASMSQFSESSMQLAETTKNLPREIREQTSILVEEIDNKQANLQSTLDKAQKTLAAVDQALAQADKTVASFQTTAVDVNQAAIAWDRAANSTQLALSEFGKLKPTRKDQPTVKIEDVHDIVEAVNQTVGEIQNATVQIRDVVESEQLADYASMPEGLVNLLAWRLGQLIAMVFVLALVYRFSVTRIAARRK
ncbi:MAG: hypothetical protein ACYSWQ_01530 [Planctomycetota bacterium]